MENQLKMSDDFSFLLTFLPVGWERQAKELGALRRCRKVPDAQTLLRVLLIHLAEGCSLRETAVRARQGQLADLSDVAIMDRLRQSGEWFRWMNERLMRRWVDRQPEAVFGPSRRVRLVDGTRVKEPGPTGSSWCIHYSVELPSLACDETLICERSGPGESFCRFAPNPGDLFVGDRAYGTRRGIAYVVRKKADVLVRFALSNLPLIAPTGGAVNLLRRLRALKGTAVGDWPVEIEHEGLRVAGRVCALRKTRQATAKARRAVERAAQKGGHKTKPETLEAAGYIFVFTTMKREDMSASRVLEMYRDRWQVELVFKRLKSILGLGHLRKSDPQAARAWLHGKLFVALLIESLIRHAESFSPWGYPLCSPAPTPALPVAGGAIHAAPAATGR